MHKLLAAPRRAVRALPPITLPAFALMCAFAAPRAPAEEITFRPTSGQRLAFSFESTSALSLTDMSMTQDGQDYEGEIPEWKISHDEKIAFTDEILEAEEGRVLKLRRTFGDISETRKQEASGPEGLQTDEKDGTSELEGSSVVFTWDAEAEEYRAAFESEGGDGDLLEDLECQVDFTVFLPAGPVSKDDTWTADAQALNAVRTPSGDLDVVFEEEEPDEDGGMSDQLDDNLEGEILCKLADLREEDGVRTAVISIQVKLTTHGNEDAEFDAPQVGTVATTQEVTIEYELEGELLWNLTAGHLTSLELAGSRSTQMDETQEITGEHQMSGTRNSSFEGTVTHRVSVE